MLRPTWQVVCAAVLTLSSASCSGGEESMSLQAAGATFPAPLYKRWFLEYYRAHPEVRVNYQAIGSGAGIRQFTAGLTAFGASDAPMSKSEIAAFEKEFAAGVQHVPLTAGAIAICYNVPGGPSDLKLTREAYVDIFLGEITNWNDSAIQKANSGVTLPDLPITVVRRAEGSGTTFAFTTHLYAVSPKKWLDEEGKPLVGKSIKWRVGLGAKGNDGVAALIQQTPGAIGYLEEGYAKLTKLPDESPMPIARLENKSGKFVEPTMATGLAAIEEAKIPENLCLSIADPAGAGSYPIVTYTWVLCHKKYNTKRKAEVIKALLIYCLTEGQKTSDELYYIPLPARLVEKARQAVEAIGSVND